MISPDDVLNNNSSNLTSEPEILLESSALINFSAFFDKNSVSDNESVE